MSVPNSPDAERFFERARVVCPTFGPIDDEGAKDWQDEPNPLDTIRAAGLAWHLSALAELGRLDLVAPVLDLAEETLVTGDNFTQAVIVEGLLEQLQSALLRTEGRVRLVDVRALLKPTCLTAWDDLMRFWHGPPDEARKRLPAGSLPDERA